MLKTVIGISTWSTVSEIRGKRTTGETEMWYCGKCKEHQRAYKVGFVVGTEILILHLKRFQYAQNRTSCIARSWMIE